MRLIVWRVAIRLTTGPRPRALEPDPFRGGGMLDQRDRRRQRRDVSDSPRTVSISAARLRACFPRSLARCRWCFRSYPWCFTLIRSAEVEDSCRARLRYRRIRLRAVRNAEDPDDWDMPYSIRADSCFCETRHSNFRFFGIPEVAFTR